MATTMTSMFLTRVVSKVPGVKQASAKLLLNEQAAKASVAAATSGMESSWACARRSFVNPQENMLDEIKAEGKKIKVVGVAQESATLSCVGKDADCATMFAPDSAKPKLKKSKSKNCFRDVLGLQ